VNIRQIIFDFFGSPLKQRHVRKTLCLVHS
jgi:hypothetical protein